MKDRIYLDTNATTPIAPEVRDVVFDALCNGWGNASSTNHYGEKAKEYIDNARAQTAEMISAQPKEIIFMSGGTEANHTVINTFSKIKNIISQAGKGDEEPNSNIASHIITTSIEHPSVRKPLQQISADGIAQVTFVEVDQNSHAVKVNDIMKAIQPNTVLVSVMLANNETGVIQPIRELSAAIKEYNNTSGQKIYLHTDAAQAIGKIPVSVEDLGVDYLTIVGHKFYGPRIGALYARGLEDRISSPPLKPVFMGGGQEKGYRSGTENTAMIAGLGKACELVSENIASYQSQMMRLRDSLEFGLSVKFKSNVSFNGKSSLSERLPNTCNFSLIGEKFNGRRVLDNCEQVVAGVGAACHSNDTTYEGSAVLLASGIPREVACNAIRLSVGRDTTPECITTTVQDILNAVRKILED